MDDQIRARIVSAITMHERGGSKSADREDLATATDIVESLLTESGPRSEVVRVFAELIERAHHHGDRKWAVTLFGDRIRLNVGAVHVGVILPGVLFLAVRPAMVDEQTRRALGPRLHQQTEYQPTGPVLELYLPMEDVADLWPTLREASLAFVDTAAARNTSFWPYHSPGLLAHLDEALGRLLPRPADRRQDDEPVDVAAIVARAREDLPPERTAARERALSDARALIEANRRSLSADGLVRLMRLFNTDHHQGRDRINRFGMAMGGHARNRIVERDQVANHWIDTLWSCGTDSEVAEALDRLREDSPLPFAGLSFPGMVLHCKDPTRYFPASSGTLARGYSRLIGTKPVDGPTYVRACEGLRRLMAEHELSPMGLDVVAWFADNLQYVSNAENDVEPETATPDPTPTGYGREQFLTQTLFEDDELIEIERLLRDKPQLVLYGPPGTGKTWIAERLARLLTGGATDRIEVVQFHPSYGYEDFIEGIRPTPDGERMTYPVVPGVFRAFCQRAERSPDETHVVVIDELNRGNLPRIFGELLFALERRGTPVKLSQSQQVMKVPRNIVVLGTMNTADQSIALLDMALRRRFHFLRLEPNAERLERWLALNVPHMRPVAGILRALNTQLRQHGVARDRLVGHSHFMRPGVDEDTLPLIWRGSITPLVEELFHGQDDVINAFDYGAFVEPHLTSG